MRVSWSRRRILTEGVLSVAVALSLPRAFARGRTESPPRLGGAPALAHRSSSAGGPGAVPEAHASAVIDWGGRLKTAVRINGRGPFHFFVDTGAERSVIADDIAARLALPQRREVLVEGIVRDERASLVEIRKLQMGSLVCSALEVPSLPRRMMNADGYLGLDVLDDRRVIFDFIAGTITITKPRGFFSEFWTHFTIGNNEVQVPTLGDSGRLRSTDCLVDGVHAAAFIDTGAEISIINPALYASLQRRKVLETMPGTQTLTGITGGSVVGVTTLLDMVHLGELAMTFTTAVVADLPVFKVWGLQDEPALLIGMDCLRRCARVSIDYRRKELRFETASAPMPQRLEAALPPPLAG
jgi:predicted aspartyl protease